MDEKQYFDETAKACSILGIQLNAPTLDLIFRINTEIKSGGGDISIKKVEQLKSETEAKYK